jgi:hypothetical protein
MRASLYNGMLDKASLYNGIVDKAEHPLVSDARISPHSNAL